MHFKKFDKEFQEHKKRIAIMQKFIFVASIFSWVVSLALLAGLIFVAYKLLVHFGIL